MSQIPIEILIKSKVLKRIQDQPNIEILNIKDISNIKININVIAENKIDKTTYTYIIHTK